MEDSSTSNINQTLVIDFDSYVLTMTQHQKLITLLVCKDTLYNE